VITSPLTKSAQGITLCASDDEIVISYRLDIPSSPLPRHPSFSWPPGKDTHNQCTTLYRLLYH
jgi:hypothetical protein